MVSKKLNIFYLAKYNKIGNISATTEAREIISTDAIGIHRIF
jgi:hypothetical protein